MEVLTESWWSPAIERQKSISVVLPPGYSPAGRPYPVLYLLHGFGGNRTTWLGCPNLAAEADAGRMILVFPESGRSWLINNAQGRRYEDYFVDEVVGHVDARYNTVANRGGRALGGFSMGGACALFHALRHGDMFSVVGSHSGAFEAPLREGDPYREHRSDKTMLMPTVRDHERVWGPVGSEIRRDYDPYRLVEARTHPLDVYLDVGLDDYDRMIAMNRNMAAALSTHRVSHDYRERPGGHDWDFVDAGLPALFDFVRGSLVTS